MMTCFISRLKPGLAIALLSLILALPRAAQAQLEVDITGGVAAVNPIAITQFMGDSEEMNRRGAEIREVVVNDLARSGLFDVLDPRGYIQNPRDAHNRPRYGDWRVIGADVLATAEVKTDPQTGGLRVDYRLRDVHQEQELGGIDQAGRTLVTVPANWRRIAHLIADDIYQRVTAEAGYFDTRIVYIAESGPYTARIKRLAIMDQDGANHQYLTDGEDLVLTPRFSPTQQEITYMSYYNDEPHVYLFNIETGDIELLGNFPGMTFAPRFSPDGETVIMSLAVNGNSDIYTLDLRTRQVRQLTDHLAIDTAPSYAPSGEQIVFESDRGGSQQIYVMDADGRNAHRISFGDGRYGTPVWSPRGDLIAFTRQYQGDFYIGVMRPDGRGERLLLRGRFPVVVEAPNWSPNGRVLTFFRQWPTGQEGENRMSRLYSIDLTGRNEREIPTPGIASDPAWSPSLSIVRQSTRR